MRFSFLVALVTVTFLAQASAGFASGSAPTIDPDTAQQRLINGNGRFVSGTNTFPRFDQGRRDDTAQNGQHPFATVISCSDSRVPVEIVFDQGIGDVFVIRVAGNVCDTDEIGSIEYGVDHLGTPIMVVLGHESCGAVTAVATGAELHGSIPPLVDNIGPAVAQVRQAQPGLSGDAFVTAAIEANVWQSIEDLLTRSPAVSARVADGRAKVFGAIYSIASGEVRWLGEHPQQGEFLKASRSHIGR